MDFSDVRIYTLAKLSPGEIRGFFLCPGNSEQVVNPAVSNSQLAGQPATGHCCKPSRLESASQQRSWSILQFGQDRI